MRWIVLIAIGVAMLGAQTPQKKRAAAVTVNGCVDQRDGAYILTDDKSIGKIAALEPDGFDRENFAKHVGHRVKMTGTWSSDSGGKVFRVRTIATVAEYCAPPE